MALIELIRKEIRASGPITIARFMELALADPDHGYYMRKDPIGAKGDFTTAPEISQIFGELIGLWLAVQWQAMGSPHTSLVEIGPGHGTLMADILRATKMVQGFHDAISVTMVETSPTLQQLQWQKLVKLHPRVEWAQDASNLPEIPTLIIANEFFDALPIRQFSDDEERMIDLDEIGDLKFTLASESITRESCEPAEQIMQQLAAHIATHKGGALFIDYGYEQGYIDTLQAIKHHEFCKPLDTPGEVDLTAHVDFGTLRAIATKAGVHCYGSIAQGALLGRLGAIERATKLCEGCDPEQQETIMDGLKRLVSPDQMGELFRCLAFVHPDLSTPEGF